MPIGRMGAVGSGRFGAAAGGPLVSESFDQTDSSTLGPNHTWTESGTDNLQTTTNRARLAAGTGSRLAICDTLMATDDHYVQMECRDNAYGNSQWAEILARSDSTGANAYTLRIVSTEAIHLFKKVADVYTSLGQVASAYTAGDTFRIEVQGTSISAWKNGVQMNTTKTDSSITSGKYVGFAIANHTSIEIDNFEADDL